MATSTKRIQIEVPASATLQLQDLLQSNGPFSELRCPAATQAPSRAGNTDDGDVRPAREHSHEVPPSSPFDLAAGGDAPPPERLTAAAEALRCGELCHKLRLQLVDMAGAGLILDTPQWNLSACGDHYTVRVVFLVEDEAMHDVIEFMKATGISKTMGSITALPCEYFKAANTIDLSDAAESAQASDQDDFQAATRRVKAQIRLEELLEKIRRDSQMTPDYISLLVAASLLAGLGLASDNVVTVIASMLVSPIMGPVLALTFGINVHDFKLAALGLAAESLSLMVCIFIGFMISIVFGGFVKEGDWPTDQMASRANLDAIALNIMFALASGLGIAVGVVSKNAASMVGTAISASLLPPAVNCGLYWGYVAVDKYFTTGAIEGQNKMTWFKWGGNSLLLTVVNIVCVMIVGVIMLRLKEFGPLGKGANRTFWQEDLSLARTLRSKLGSSMAPDKLRTKLHTSLSQTRALFQAKKKPVRSLQRQEGRKSGTLHESLVASLLGTSGSTDVHKGDSVATKYGNVLKLAQRGTRANDKGSEEILDNLYDLFGRNTKAKAKHRSAVLQQELRMSGSLGGAASLDGATSGAAGGPFAEAGGPIAERQEGRAWDEALWCDSPEREWVVDMEGNDSRL